MQNLNELHSTGCQKRKLQYRFPKYASNSKTVLQNIKNCKDMLEFQSNDGVMLSLQKEIIVQYISTNILLYIKQI